MEKVCVNRAMDDSVNILIQNGYTVVVTDNRYPYEIENKHPCITIRMFRLDVAIPPAQENSEHSMDTFKCDFVLCKSNEDFEILKKTMPQYNEYVYLAEFSQLVS